MKKLTLLGLSIAITAIFSACNQKKEGTDAVVEEAKKVEEIAATAKEYNIEASLSHVSYVGSKVGGKHYGTIPVSKGTIAVENDNITGGRFTIEMGQFDNEDLRGVEGEYGHDSFINHIKGADFFDVENYPTATFEITSVVPFDSNAILEVKEEYESDNKPLQADEHIVDSPTHTITGNLTMKGVTKSLTFPTKVQVSDSEIKAKAKFNIDRTVWGIKYGDESSAVDKAKDRFIYNTVNVGFDISAKAPAQ